MIIDIDGTVADARHRLHLIAGTADRKYWGRFFDAAGDDPPIPAGIKLARELAEHCDLFWITGRPERTRALTMRWLAARGLPVDRLLMYPPGERRPTREVKVDHVRVIGQERRVKLVVDDDPRVIAALRELGFPTLLATGVPWSDPGQPGPTGQAAGPAGQPGQAAGRPGQQGPAEPPAGPAGQPAGRGSGREPLRHPDDPPDQMV